MFFLIMMWVGIVYAICKGIAGACMHGSGKAGGVFIFNVIWFILCMYVGATANQLAVAMTVWLFVGVILNAMIAGDRSNNDEVRKQDKYDNDYGIIEDAKKK